MPSPLDAEKLSQQVIRDEDIADAIAKSGGNVTPEYIAAKIRDASKEIQEISQSASSRVEELERQIEATEEALSTAQTPTGVEFAAMGMLGWSVIGLAVLSAIDLWNGGTALAIEAGYSRLRIIFSIPDQFGLWTFPLPQVTAFLDLVSIVVLIRWRWSLPIRVKRVTDVGKLPDLRAMLPASVQALDESRKAAGLAVAREAINNATSLLVQTRLYVDVPPPKNEDRVSRASGLSQVESFEHDITTGARRTMLKLLERLPGGSIGVAGPRGAGKTSLLKSLCGTNPTLRDEKALTIYTSAPVEYESRDFLLHLFSTLCIQALRLRPDPPSEEDDYGADIGDEQTQFRSLIMKALVFLVTSTALLGGAAVVIVMAIEPDITPRGVWDPPPTQSLVQKIAGLLKPVAATLAQYSILSLLLAIAAAYSVFLIRTYERSADRRKTSGDSIDRSIERFIERSRHMLRKIRFQLSYSYGWTGSLRAPAGIDLGRSRAISWAQRQRTMPELVQDFREFVELIPPNFQKVLIAIDELDKIKTSSKAEQFINDIKAIFGIPRTFYLISVSDNALSSFERRSMGVRDAFDSAFDEMVQIPYLTLDESRRLLGRRMLHFPDQFVGLCHVLSGGLPRELIRFARSSVEAAAGISTGIEVSTLARRLIEENVKRKIHAALIATRSVTTDPHATIFLQQLSTLDKCVLTEMTPETMLLPPSRTPSVGEQQNNSAEQEGLRVALQAHIRWARVALSTFEGIRSDPDWNSLASSGSVDWLARLKQQCELNPSIANDELDAWRFRQRPRDNADDEVPQPIGSSLSSQQP